MICFMKPFIHRFEYELYMIKLIRTYIHNHLEWMVFTIGLIALALMSPDTTEPTLCLLDRFGIAWCPGDGLGHSISYTFRGDFISALEANFVGPFAVLILVLRIIYLIKKNVVSKPQGFIEEKEHG